MSLPVLAALSDARESIFFKDRFGLSKFFVESEAGFVLVRCRLCAGAKE